MWSVEVRIIVGTLRLCGLNGETVKHMAVFLRKHHKTIMWNVAIPLSSGQLYSLRRQSSLTPSVALKATICTLSTNVVTVLVDSLDSRSLIYKNTYNFNRFSQE